MNKVVSTGVFDRNGNDSISSQSFYATLTLSLLWGLIATAIIAYKAIEVKYMPGIGAIIVFGLIMPIIGIFIAVKSDNPAISFLGYNLVIVPFGIIIGPSVNHYSPDVIRNAFGVTASITFFMGFMGTCFPNLFKNLGMPLFLALCGLVLVRIAQLFIPALDLTIIDYIAAGIFSLYIAFDMYRASEMPKTIDNAIDLSVDLYLDVINLFLNILKIMGSKNED
ncbi:MAG: Bax inhibitor-1 family protein [Candidatus Paceibacterota bacterium]